MRLDSNIGVADGTRRNEYAGSGRELNHETEVEQNEVPTLGGVIRSTSEDGIKAIRDVGAVDVVKGNNTGPTVEGAGWEDAVVERSVEVEVLCKQGM